MKFNIFRTSEIYDPCYLSDFEPPKPCENTILNKETNLWEIELNSLEELNELTKEVGCCIIFHINKCEDTNNSLEIYDDYRE